MAAGTQAPRSIDHLCVLVHGLWGNPDHLWYLKKKLGETYPDNVHILVAKRNSGSYTYDGIETGGERVTNEIEEELEQLAKAGHNIKKISIIGYSLGGLVSRYAIGLLYNKGWFDKLEPVNFTTFATPHLGARTPLRGYGSHLWNVLGARMLSVSGQQLFMIDSFRDTGRPLLSVLADPDSIFVQGLSKFKNKSLYANIVNDRSVVYYSSSMSSTDPYVDTDAVDVHYLKGYEPILLDPEDPVALKNHGRPLTVSQQVTGKAYKALKGVPFLIFLAIFLPLGTTAFVASAAIQSVKSQRRIKEHEEGKTGYDFGVYRIPVLLSKVRQEAEDMYENVNNTHGEEYIPTSSESVVKSPKAVESAETLIESKSPRSDDFPTLALTEEQFTAIESMDKLGLKKYPVFIHGERHSHASIINRKPRLQSKDGKVVVRHWLDNFET